MAGTRFLFVTLLVLPSWGWQSADQTLQDKLTAVTASYSVSNSDWLQALAKVAGDFQLPMGIEWIKVTGNPVPISLSWRDTTPLAILRDVVKAYPGYELDFGNGVVHVFPTAMKGDRADVLNARLGTFEVRNQTIPMAAASTLASPVRDIMVPQDPNSRSHGTLSGSVIGNLNDERVTFRIENATVRDALDKLCLSADRKVWVVAYPPNPTKTHAGFLKMVSLFNDEVRADFSFVPTWSLMRWGYSF